ncbi:MAG: polyisoprenoid-binding protein [Burkholderiales bacterium]|jgi:polyisoprenoid-binding protein YceI|nr:polyisoprenoid-binding protein [Burkholderiales bacterium]
MKKALLALAVLSLAGIAQAETATYAIDPTHTFVTFEAKHFNTSTLRGRFDKKEGTVAFDRAAKVGKAEITLDTSSISTGVPALDTHLKGKDFFDAAQAPSVKFVSDKFNFEGDKVSGVAGQLTMLGKTVPVTLKATNFNCYNNPLLKREVCGGDFETTIARTQWGMDYGLQYGLPDNIRLLIQVEAVKQ